MNTAGFACRCRQCPYCSNSDASFHALVGDGKHGSAEPIQTFRGPACRTTFSARRNTPLYRLKTPSHLVAVVRITRWPKGWTHLRPNGSQGYRQATITSLSDSRGAACSKPPRAYFLSPPASLSPVGRAADEAAQPPSRPVAVVGHRPRTRDPSCPASGPSHAKRYAYRDPCPTANLGRLPASHSSPAMVSTCISMRLSAHFGHWLVGRRRGRRVCQWQVAAGLIYRQVKKSRPSTEAGSRHACDVPWHRSCSHQRFAETGFLWTIEHCMYGARECDGPTWHCRAGETDLGDGAAVPTPVSPSGMVASVLSFCSSSPLPARSARAATRARGNLVAQRYRQRTPAMAAGRTNRRWTAREVLSCPLTPASA